MLVTQIFDGSFILLWLRVEFKPRFWVSQEGIGPGTKVREKRDGKKHRLPVLEAGLS
ncbi:PAS/PAC Sensor sensor histidine kinase [Desmospora sp. 8437]|nr:PAS/PAC Sensor sensor histidine kinase [Desmospora sp. 8437]